MPVRVAQVSGRRERGGERKTEMHRRGDVDALERCDQTAQVLLFVISVLCGPWDSGREARVAIAVCRG